MLSTLHDRHWHMVFCDRRIQLHVRMLTRGSRFGPTAITIQNCMLRFKVQRPRRIQLFLDIPTFARVSEQDPRPTKQWLDALMQTTFPPRCGIRSFIFFYNGFRPNMFASHLCERPSLVCPIMVACLSTTKGLSWQFLRIVPQACGLMRGECKRWP